MSPIIYYPNLPHMSPFIAPMEYGIDRSKKAEMCLQSTVKIGA